MGMLIGAIVTLHVGHTGRSDDRTAVLGNVRLIMHGTVVFSSVGKSTY